MEGIIFGFFSSMFIDAGKQMLMKLGWIPRKKTNVEVKLSLSIWC